MSRIKWVWFLLGANEASVRSSKGITLTTHYSLRFKTSNTMAIHIQLTSLLVQWCAFRSTPTIARSSWGQGIIAHSMDSCSTGTPLVDWCTTTRPRQLQSSSAVLYCVTQLVDYRFKMKYSWLWILEDASGSMHPPELTQHVTVNG